MDHVEALRARATDLENEGYEAALNGAAYDHNPYLLRSKEWEMWRLGWARGNWKASTE